MDKSPGSLKLLRKRKFAQEEAKGKVAERCERECVKQENAKFEGQEGPTMSLGLLKLLRKRKIAQE